MLSFTTPSGKTGDPSVLYQAQCAGEVEMRRENIRRNVARGLPKVGPDSATRGSDIAKLVCFGPSLADNWEHAALDEGDLWTVSGANRYLWERGIAARFHLEADPRPHKAQLLIASCPDTTYLIASRCSPEMFEVLANCKMLLYHVYATDEAQILSEIAPGDFQVPPGWTMGNTALSIQLLLGYKKIRIYGMDGSFAEDGRQHPDAHPNEEKMQQSFTVDGGRKFLSSPSHVVAAECFIKLMSAHPYGTFEFVGDGLIPWTYHCYTKDYR